MFPFNLAIKKDFEVITFTEKEFLKKKITLQQYKIIPSTDYFICDDIHNFICDDIRNLMKCTNDDNPYPLIEPEKKILFEMMNYYCSCDYQKNNYKKTEFLCDYDNKICLHNRYAKIMNNYKIDENNSIIKMDNSNENNNFVAFLYNTNKK
jgi:hypothetical protein